MLYSAIHVGTYWKIQDRRQIKNDKVHKLNKTQEKQWGYRGGSPTAVRPSDPALCGSCPL